MSDTRGTGREAGGRHDRLDAAIDRAVREMLDVEPPPGLRRRVVDRLERRDAPSGWNRIVWFAAPLAAAALLILAVLIPSLTRSPQPASDPTTTAGTQPHRDAPPVASSRPSGTAAAQARPGSASARVIVPTPARRGAPAAAPRRVLAAVVADDERPGESVAPLSINPLVLPALAAPAAASLPSTAPQPLAIRALEITALPETPRERREE